MLNITKNAQDQINKILTRHDKKFFRITINSGGCNGLIYEFSYENNINEDDILIQNIIIDAISQPFLNNSTIDFSSTSLIKKEFIISNPNASKSCGCNKSFA